MNRRVTYLLGAGASANALPVVRKMNNRFQHFNNYIAYKYQDYPDAAVLSKEILNSIMHHATVDTYAKKLFLQEKLNDGAELELIKLKHYLSLFFIAEQLSFYKGYRKHISLKTISKDEVDQHVGELVDRRYDPFLASLLNKTDKRLVLNDNINIVSWNYDSQIELAYLQFAKCGPNQAFSELNVMPPKNRLDSGSRIVKLNGTAGILNANSELYSFWGENYNELTDVSFGELVEKFANLKNYDKLLRINERVPDEHVVNFAWERDGNNISQNAVNAAKRIFSETETLVIIGYTFPNFNRVIDRELMEEARGNINKIYYQAPEEEIEGLKIRLKGIVPPSIRETIESKDGFVAYTELEQFCIPYEI